MSKSSVGRIAAVARITVLAVAAAAAFASAQTFAQGSPTGLPHALNVNVTNTPLPVTVQNPTNSPVPVAVVPPVPQLNRIVNLMDSVTACPGGFPGARKVHSRIGGNGERTDFEIPAGASLVITALTLRLLSNTDQNILVRLGVPCGAGCMNPIVDATVRTDNGIGQGSTHLTFPEGIVVSAGTVLCVADVNFASPNAHAQVYGRLVGP